ncbi:lytic transglycosylase domain-containing protein [Streptomyces sp. ISL-112]|uniref:lytic transglycosylase domain-containing protein n=1 Tax=unclassified Streptomyces TaxID=2593676 RepID=UPI001BE6C8C3|nr:MULTISPECIES: lytic transglycosylase domain-containing protein [unclassified Streptomyces]MBT2427411.1 lytic transglycosylase domain-containing protein [Streptomyces sp. ISL-112]MBT2464446.1 lytic transglycosylase domain-containing protein [Streptomyces sp. ISL-63]
MKFNGTVRRQLTGTVTAVAAMAALTASQAPGFGDAVAVSATSGTDDVVWSEVEGDDAYHTELPPLESPQPPAPLKPPRAAVEPSLPLFARARSEAGIPATVLAAYRNAERSLRRGDPGCRLPWQLLAAIGKVESGQAAGGRVDARGTTLTPILGPALDGVGFALIRDTDNGVHDGDRTYDRAVGPMQFIPSTWANWAMDGNGDGRKDPDNIYDAALAAGHYLCAGGRDLGVRAELDRAILSYNRSDVYLRTVLSWLEFYRKGTHPVADGRGVLPTSPGPGGTDRPTAPVGSGPSDKPGKGGGIVIGPRPPRPPGPKPTPGPTKPGSPSPSPSEPGTPSPTPTDPGPTDPGPSPDPTDPGPGPTDPGPTPTGPTPTDPGPTDPDPGPSPDPGTTDQGCPSGDPTSPGSSTAIGSRSGEYGDGEPCAPEAGSAA